MATTYVKAWAFFVAIIAMSVSITTTAVLYGESQSTQGLIKKLTTDFETRMINITTNNSVLMSTAMATFQAQLATVNAQVESLATAKGNLEAQVATLTDTNTALQTMYVNQLNITTTINTTWSVFLKALSKGQLKLKESNVQADNGKANFTDARNALVATTYGPAMQNATYARANYNSSRNLYNTSLLLFQSANNKVIQNWTNAFVAMYINLNPMIQNFTYEMNQACYYLYTASYYYSVANTTAGDANKAIMLSRWNLYNTSYVSYTNSLKAIDVMLGAL